MAKEITDKKPKKMTYGEMLEEAVRVGTETAAKVALSTFTEIFEKDKKAKRDKDFRNTKKLLVKYRWLKEYSENAVFDASQLEDFDIIKLVSGIDDADKFKVESVQNQVAYTRTIMSHVETMLSVYKARCLSSHKSEVQRRWRVIESMYIVGYSAPDISTIAAREAIDGRTVYKDIDKACDELSYLFFGIDLMNFIV